MGNHSITFTPMRFLHLFIILQHHLTGALNIVIAGGTGPIGKALIPKLAEHEVTILCRNAFLAATPSRVSSDYGWLGESFMDRQEHARLRDWDAGDMLDIVGCDFLGWQEDALKGCDVVVNLVGGFTDQRTKAAERIIRECVRVNPNVFHVSVSPVAEELGQKIKRNRVQAVEDMYEANCPSYVAVRSEYNRVDDTCNAITQAIQKSVNV